LNRAGIYFIDDLLPQPNWPEGHAPRVPALIEDLECRTRGRRLERLAVGAV
jgi:hypothetical protein